MLNGRRKMDKPATAVLQWVADVFFLQPEQGVHLQESG
jgi:hypothetical protein